MRKQIDFLRYRNVMFALSAILLVVSAGALLTRGLTFGIEFQGGTVINVADAGNVTIEQMRSALEKAGVTEPDPQTTETGGVKGFIIRTEETNPDVSAKHASDTAKALGLPQNSIQVTTIGPGWGRNITDRALLAFGLSIIALLLYISLRYEYKMSVTAVLALVHDMVITLGVYALVGAEVTPNTVAALLSIMGFSLYDTVVVFHRIKENGQTLSKQSFMDMANESLNEVIVRTINTTLTSIIPVLVMLIFGGESLHDFALALTIGLVIGAYSSIGVATPLFAIWKETEPKFAALKKKYANA